MTEITAAVDKLEAGFAETVQHMEKQFTSHEFLLRLMHTHQNEYVAGLSAFTSNGKPFKELHHELIKRLKKLDGTVITLQHANYPSRDIFGVTSYATLWRKK
ncbi:MAG: hypothetical protein BWK79_09700 [Beggiatoa sp. IS2]|nr:MAG: hypothetical protein BWK79_09700 [Beggiatoa sp. IS2]